MAHIKKTTAFTHLYRLGALFIVFVVAFVVIRQMVTPSSWNYEVWYRGDSMIEVENLPPVYGGNESCKTCHAEIVEETQQWKHKNLSCEGCHDPLTSHVSGEEKIANATVINQSSGQCLNCHAESISKPQEFPQYTNKPRRHRSKQEKVCLECHDPHDPTM